MDRNPYTAPATHLEMATPGTVSMAWYGFVCLIGLLVTFIVLVLVTRIGGFSVPQGTGIVALLASVQLANWRFVQTHRRVMSAIELKRFAIACAFVFWMYDEGLVIIRRLLTPSESIIKTAITAVVASGIDVAIVLAIVYFTVPKIARYFASKLAVNDP